MLALVLRQHEVNSLSCRSIQFTRINHADTEYEKRDEETRRRWTNEHACDIARVI